MGAPKWPLVLVEWEDAYGHSGGGWEHLTETLKIVKPALVWTVGLLISQSKDGVKVALSVGIEDEETDDEGVNGWIFIPAGMIKRISKLKEVK